MTRRGSVEMDEAHFRGRRPLRPQIRLADGLVACGTSRERLVVRANERLAPLLMDRLRELAEFRVVHCFGNSGYVDFTDFYLGEARDNLKWAARVCRSPRSSEGRRCAPRDRWCP